MRKRTKGRAWAIQVAYSSLLSGKDFERSLNEFCRFRRITVANRLFTGQLLTKMQEHVDEVDSLFISHLENWSFHRLAVLDKVVLRLAVTELLFLGDIPPKVTINEYVQLARLFGTEDSPRFINGVLDAVFKSLNKAGAQAPGGSPA
jgi:transcription antitermination protein NusB